MCRHTSPDVSGRACVDASILKLSVVYDQLADVGDHEVPPDVVWSHDGVVLALQLFLPRDLRMGLSRHLTQEAGGLANKNRLLDGTAVYGGELDVGGEGGLERSGWM